MQKNYNVDIFKLIYCKILNNNNKIVFKKYKTRYILDKIKTVHDKYFYYSELDIELYYFLSQKYYFIIYNFIKRIKYKKYKIYNK